LCSCPFLFVLVRSRFCIWEGTWHICLSQSGLFCLTWLSLFLPFSFRWHSSIHL
jgi:hypothetical protein